MFSLQTTEEEFSMALTKVIHNITIYHLMLIIESRCFLPSGMLYNSPFDPTQIINS